MCCKLLSNPISASCESSSNSSSNSPPPSTSNSTSTASPVLSPISAGPCSCPLLLPFDCASGLYLFVSRNNRAAFHLALLYYLLQKGHKLHKSSSALSR